MTSRRIEARRCGGSPGAALALFLAVAVGLIACDEALVESPPADGRPQIVAVTSQQLVAQFGVQLDTPLRVRVFDADGRPIRSAVVHYGVLVGSGIFSADSTVTNDQGFTEVTFRPFTTGTVIVEARIGGSAGSDGVQFTILVLSDPDEVASFERVSGDAQVGPAGSVLPDPLVVRVQNGDGFPVKDHPVTFTLQLAQGDSAGVAASRSEPVGGQVTVLTDEGGLARAFLRLGTRAGTHTVTARTSVGPEGAITSETVSFTATATALPAARLIIIAGNNQTAVIDTLHEEESPDFQGRDPNPLVLQAVDRFGAPVAGVAVQWRVSDGGGQLVSSVTVTDANGFTENLVIDITEGRNAIVAFAAGTNVVEFVITGRVFVPQEDTGGGGGGGG